MTSAVTTARLSDEETTIRIVLDGAPYAGKTTAAYSLGEALGGATTTPEEDDGRTVWFDWMTYTGGRHDGKAIRVELVTVPGQDELVDRRRHLVEWADVVVFIADTSAAAFDATEAKFAELQRDLEANAKDAHTVVVANKRDLDDALDIDTVRARLGLTDSAPLVEGVATDGAGMRQAFIFAVRAALAASVNRPDVTTANELLAQMQETLGVDVEPDQAAPSAPADVAVENEAVEVEAEAGEDEAAEAVEDDKVEVEAEAVEDEVQAEPQQNDDEVYEQLKAELLPYRAATRPVTSSGSKRTRLTASASSSTQADDEDVNDQAPVTAEQSEPTEPSEPAVIDMVDAHLVRDGLVGEQALVLHRDHWQLLVALGSGRTNLPLSNGSAAARVATEFRSWGLLDGTIRTSASLGDGDAEDAVLGHADLDEPDVGDSVEDEDALDTDADDADPGRSNERYRALRELRRNLRRR